MNKLRKQDYLILICEELVKTYGGTLIEADTDLKMAKAVLKKMSRYLHFHPLKEDKKEFQQWREEFLQDYGYEDGN